MDIVDENEYLQIWREALQSPIGPDDDLIEAGGDSIRTIMLLTRLYDTYGVDLELWDLLDAGTPRKVFELIRTAHPPVP